MSDKIKSKGTILAQSIAAVFVPIPGIVSIDVSGEMPETFDGTTLDGPKYKLKPATGFVEPPEISFEMFYDPGDPTHIAFETLVGTPVDTDFKLTLADAAPTSTTYTGTSCSLDKKIAASDGVKASCKITTSGNPV